jgi:26S proteasome regulatory subunit N10
LKHRQNKAQRQRIIIFNCSPILEEESSLVKLAKKMKKQSIYIDFVAFGEIDDDVTKKLEAFNNAVKGSEGSYLAVIPPGPGLLSDQLLASPILNEGASAAGMGGGDAGAGGESFEFGIDPSVDPELALALRMSMEEEKQRQDKIAKEEAAKKAPLEDIKEGDESAPLLDQNGEPSGSGGGESSKKDGGDKMDTD